MRVRVGMMLTAAVLCCGLTGCTADKEKTPDAQSSPVASATSVPKPVEVSESVEGCLQEQVNITGHLRAISKADVCSRVAGRVVAVNFREGDRVHKGDALIKLDDSVLRVNEKQAEANLAAARARVDQASTGVGLTDSLSDLEINRAQQSVYQARANTASAQADYDDALHQMNRQRGLFAQDAVSRYAVEQAELRCQVAKEKLEACKSAEQAAREGVRIAQENRRQVGVKESELEAAQAAVKQAQAALEAIRVDIKDTVMVAPCSGTITKRNVEAGQSIGASSGTVLMQIVDNSVLEMVAPVDERYRASIVPNGKLMVSTTINEPVSAKIVDIIPVSDPSTHTLKVRLHIPNEKGLLVEGAYASAVLRVRDIYGVIVPYSAINKSSDGIFVADVTSGSVKRCPVEVVYSTEDQAIVTGIPAGIKVITSSALEYENGQAITEVAPDTDFSGNTEGSDK